MAKAQKNMGPRGTTVTETLAPTKVKMKFSKHQYYNDLNTPLFYQGEVYELEGADWIQRWIKRGGEIVSGKAPVAVPEPANPSILVDQADKEVVTDSSKDETATNPGKAADAETDAELL